MLVGGLPVDDIFFSQSVVAPAYECSRYSLSNASGFGHENEVDNMGGVCSLNDLKLILLGGSIFFILVIGISLLHSPQVPFYAL